MLPQNLSQKKKHKEKIQGETDCLYDLYSFVGILQTCFIFPKSLVRVLPLWSLYPTNTRNYSNFRPFSKILTNCCLLESIL